MNSYPLLGQVRYQAILPEIMNIWFYVLFVDLPYTAHLLFTQWRKLRGACIRLCLIPTAGSRYDAAHLFKHEHPPKCNERKIFTEHLFELLDGGKALFVIYAGKGFALVEKLSLTVKEAVIPLIKHCVLAELTCQ